MIQILSIEAHGVEIAAKARCLQRPELDRERMPKRFKATSGEGYRLERSGKSGVGNRGGLPRAYVVFDCLWKLRVNELDREAFFKMTDDPRLNFTKRNGRSHLGPDFGGQRRAG